MSNIQKRYDSIMQQSTGIGTYKDKLSGIQSNPNLLSPTEALNWYMSSGFLQNIVDIPAEDSTREWIKIKTNRDDLQISRKIINRMEELKLQQKIKELVRYSRIYNTGAFLFYGIDNGIPQANEVLQTPITNLNKIEYINVITPERVNVQNIASSSLSINYHNPQISFDGVQIHKTRYNWLVHSYLPEKSTGISILQTVLEAIKSQEVSLWSITSLLSELSAKVFKSPHVPEQSPEKVAELTSNIRALLSTQSVLAIADTEELTRVDTQIDSEIKSILDYILDNLAGLSRIPKSRLTGQAQGVLTAGQYDLLSYYDSISKFQEIEIKPILEKAINLILKEESGEIYRTLQGNTNQLDWTIEFNPLWRTTETEKTEMELKQAQRDKLYIETAVLSPDEIRKKRFSELEEFSSTLQTEVLNFSE